MKKFVSCIFVALLILFSFPITNAHADEEVPVIPINRKVMILVFNPYIENNIKTIDFFGWNSPETLTNQLISALNTNSHGKVNYTIPANNFVESLTFPMKCDHNNSINNCATNGYIYTGQAYKTCILTGQGCYSPDMANYNKILTDFNICSKVNSGEIDELWMFGGPYMGFAEANQAGPNAFDTNGEVVKNTSCGKILSIMGFSYEVGLDQMTHDFVHRTEGTLRKIYKVVPAHACSEYDGPAPSTCSLGQVSGCSYYACTETCWPTGTPNATACVTSTPNQTTNNWGKYMSSPFWYDNTHYVNSYYGCGNAHWDPTATSLGNDYDFTDPNRYAFSICNDMDNFPNLGDPLMTKQYINCSSWGCTKQGYYNWQQLHLPHVAGINSDGKFNDWWQYLVNPDTIFSTPQAEAALLINNTDTTATIPPSGAFSLNWNSEFAQNCTASGSWSGTRTASGHTMLTPPPTPGNYNYSIQCGNSQIKTVTITVPAVIDHFNATYNGVTSTDIYVPPYTTFLLSWSSNSSSCIATGAWNGTKAGEGSQYLQHTLTNPDKILQYRLTCGTSPTSIVRVRMSMPAPI